MLRSLKLILYYFGYQIAVTSVVSFLFLVYIFFTHNPVENEKVLNMILTMAIAPPVMIWHLYHYRYISCSTAHYSVGTPKLLVFSLTLGISFMFFANWLNDLLPLPNWLETEFKDIERYPLGIAVVAILGPIAEEVLFRGAVMDELIRKYTPAFTILISALLFGIIHFNPAQVIFAFLYGLVLGWLYYRTGSLLLCILLHILNNSTSVILDRIYPDVESLSEIMGETNVHIGLALSTIVFVFSMIMISRQTARLKQAR